MEQLIVEILKVVGAIIAGIFAIVGYFIKDAYQTLKQNKSEMETRVEKAEAQSLAHHTEVRRCSSMKSGVVPRW